MAEGTAMEKFRVLGMCVPSDMWEVQQENNETMWEGTAITMSQINFNNLSVHPYIVSARIVLKS